VLNGGSGAAEEDGTDGKDSKDSKDSKDKKESGTAFTVQECIDMTGTPSAEDMAALLPYVIPPGKPWKKSYYNSLPPGIQAIILPKCR
jgi:hypothetical protein